MTRAQTTERNQRVCLQVGSVDRTTSRPVNMRDSYMVGSGSLDWHTSRFGTHSMRRAKAAQIVRKDRLMRAAQLLLDHTKLESTVRYLGVELDELQGSLSRSNFDVVGERGLPRSLT